MGLSRWTPGSPGGVVICTSTRSHAPAVAFRQAVVAGLAPDGGLYVPATIPRMSPDWWEGLRGRSLQQVAVAMSGALLGDELEARALSALVHDALDFPIPLVPLDDGLAVLELFHGPTFAFKDIGARTLARLLSHFHEDGSPLTVLVATSGDTGSAVAQAFYGVPRTRVVVLYPHGQVSDVQEAQFTTLGGNVTAVAVNGTFDDCQRLAKEAFGSPSLRDLRLTSANSISLGRLIPQMFYYGYAAAQGAPGSTLAVSVPSGNFGNLVAGVMARMMGAPISIFAAPTNVNDTVPRYLSTGTYDPRPSVPTVANAMDVGNPSNFERLQWLFSGDRAAVRSVIVPSVHTDDQALQAIRDLDRQYGYLADPHTAIGFLGSRSIDAGSATRTVFLGTAHPAKFGEIVQRATGKAVQLPAALAQTMTRERHIERIDPTLVELANLL